MPQQASIYRRLFIIGCARAWPTSSGARVALGLLGLYTLLCYAEALELVRSRAGGLPRR
jgi:hypothetical protein